MSSYNIGVVLPSRGLIFADTLKELLRELEGVEHKIYWSHGNPIPKCFNRPLYRALIGNHTHIWFVEEDMILPEGVLRKLLQRAHPAVAADYPLVDAPSGTVLFDPNGDAFFSGTGCLLVERQVFDSLDKPFFTTDIQWSYQVKDGKMHFKPQKSPKNIYGYHDVTFGLQMYVKNPIKIIDMQCYQRKLDRLGEQGTNQGAHTIKELRDYKPLPTITMAAPNSTLRQLVEVYVYKEDKMIYLFEQTAQKLVDEGRARYTKIETEYAVLDFTDAPKIMERFL